ncbi:hypothetical protein ACFXHA_26605 [Nocardia sp. NPDC059240]|uniref:hypothetical protein n=1 Tax=Nocardia sp. NPDC059240 TaxID=3346786 RepID=UPI0036B66F28
MAVELAEIRQCLARGDEVPEVVFPDLGSAELLDVPVRWRATVEAIDPQERCRAALSLWNSEFLELVPTFAENFRSELAEVRIGRVENQWVLIYAAEHYDDERYVACWIGWDPTTFGDRRPPLWDAIPEPVQRFLREVHAGFTAPDWRSFGPVQPRRMLTFAARSGYPDGIPGWNAAVDSTRLLPLAATYSGLLACVSPDLPPGQAVLIYQGDLDPSRDVGQVLDKILDTRFAVVNQEVEL